MIGGIHRHAIEWALNLYTPKIELGQKVGMRTEMRAPVLLTAICIFRQVTPRAAMLDQFHVSFIFDRHTHIFNAPIPFSEIDHI